MIIACQLALTVYSLSKVAPFQEGLKACMTCNNFIRRTLGQEELLIANTRTLDRVRSFEDGATFDQVIFGEWA